MCTWPLFFVCLASAIPAKRRHPAKQVVRREANDQITKNRDVSTKLSEKTLWSTFDNPAVGQLCTTYHGRQQALESRLGVKGLANASRMYNPPKKCRGWRLLKRLTGLEVVAIQIVAKKAQAGTTSRLFGLRACRIPTAKASLSVYVIARSETVLDANIVTVDLSEGGGAVAWTPHEPGNYSLTTRLHFFDDECGRIPLYLGASEPRCSPSVKCLWPRLDVTCDKASQLLDAPDQFVVVGRQQIRQDSSQCTNGETDDGYWKNTLRSSSDNDFSGDPELLVSSSIHKDDPKMYPWRFSRLSCTYHYFHVSEALACLKGAFVVFLGDSLLRGLFSNVVRLLGGSANDEKLKAMIDHKHSTGQPKFSVDLGSTRLVYAQMWFSSEIPKMTKIIQRAWSGLDKSPGRILVFANFGAEHALHAACSGTFSSIMQRSLHSIAQVFKPTKIFHAVFVTPTAVLARRNPGMTTNKGSTVAADMRALAANLTQEPPAWLEPEARVNVLDLGNLTKARFDATLDGVHYGQTAATMAGMIALNLLCPRPSNAQPHATR